MRRSGSFPLLLTGVLLAFAPQTSSAQDPPPPPAPPPAKTVPAPAAPPAAAPPQPAPPAASAGPRKGPNVRVEVTIKDQRPTEPLVTKNVSIVVASGEQGRVRTFVRGQGSEGSLNIDAYPAVQDGARVALRIGLEYRHPKPGVEEPDAAKQDSSPDKPPIPVVIAGDPTAETRVDEVVWVVLDDGKPMLVTQSADPVTDRKVSVEVKATILK